jgi:glycosyltransferase involved in cell wall biosynthesis
VAVITPVHHGASHLARCVESVLSQTYSHWQYVIVNEGTAATRAAAEACARRDPRIRLQPAADAGFAAALHSCAADARYCKIVLPDDWLHPQCLERMVDVAEDHPRVALVSAYTLAGDWVVNEGLTHPSTVVPGREIARQSLLHGLSVFGSPSSVLWRADVIRARDPFYDEQTRHAHMETCFDLLQEWDFGFVHQVLTFTHEDAAALGIRNSIRAVSRVACLHRFGPAFLTPAELAATTRDAWRAYYTYLGWGLLRRQGGDFWAHHRTELRRIGKTIQPERVAWGAARAVWDLLRHPATLPGAVRRSLARIRG